MAVGGTTTTGSQRGSTSVACKVRPCDAPTSRPAGVPLLGILVADRAVGAEHDGKHVVHPAQATGFAEQLYHAGFHPIGVDLSELLKGGGSVKCCTLEVFS